MKKITDKIRLNWLENKFKSVSKGKIIAIYKDGPSKTVRQAVDAAIESEDNGLPCV